MTVYASKLIDTTTQSIDWKSKENEVDANGGIFVDRIRLSSCSIN